MAFIIICAAVGGMVTKVIEKFCPELFEKSESKKQTRWTDALRQESGR